VRRRAILAALVIVLVSSSARAADPDPWFARDKAAHFGVATGIAAGSYAVAAAVFDARGHALIAAGAFTIALGAGKEAADLAGLGTASWKDFAWDGIGTVVGLAVAWTVDRLVRGGSPRHPPFGAPQAGAAPVLLVF
jgi:uncharacterized protein YfiM (DUF2279 family)